MVDRVAAALRPTPQTDQYSAAIAQILTEDYVEKVESASHCVYIHLCSVHRLQRSLIDLSLQVATFVCGLDRACLFLRCLGAVNS